MIKVGVGRPSEYSEEIAERICEEVAFSRVGLERICQDNDDFPSARQFFRWLEASESLRQRYLRARELQSDCLMDDTIEIADDKSRDVMVIGREGEEREVANTEFIQRSKVRIDTRFRLAGKLHPKKWGDKLAMEHSGEVDIKVVIGGDDLGDDQP